MHCPKCNDRTEVLRTTQLAGNRCTRRRRCISPRCAVRFTTTEATRDVTEIQAAMSAESLASRLQEIKPSGRFDNEALSAALAVDRRKAAIRRAQRAVRDAERATEYESGFAPAPVVLDADSLRAELGYD